MRQFLLLTLLSVPLLSMADEPSLNILGVAVNKGMKESYIRSVLPIRSCVEFPSTAGHATFSCSVSDKQSSGADGNVLFENGIVIQASRNWFFPENATPFEVASMLNKAITRLSGEDHAVCTKIESSPGVIYTPEGEPSPTGIPSKEIRSGSKIIPARTSIAFPEKVLTISMHAFHGNLTVMTESLRQNPVPKHFKVEGDKLRGNEWCGYVN